LGVERGIFRAITGDNMDSIPSGTAGGPIPPITSFSAGFHISGARQQILGAINARSLTDRRIPAIWVLLPIVVYLIGFVALLVIIGLQYFDILSQFLADPNYSPTQEELLQRFGPAIDVGVLWSIIAFALFAVLTYKLITRHNEHFEREAHLRMGILSFLRAAAGSPEMQAMISSEIATMNMLHSDASYREPRRNPILWALVIGLMWVPIFELIAAILSLYMFYFLMKEIWEHDNRFHAFMAQTYSALQKLGYSFSPVFGARRIEKRSFVLYLVISLLTMGLFVLYWWYVLAKDPGEHYRQQWSVEDHLLSTIAQK